MSRSRDLAPAQRRFLLEPASSAGKLELTAADGEHARRVLRLTVGDALVGLDRRGGAWPLRVRAEHRGGLEVESTGDPVFEPEPGAPGAPLPWFELWLSLPRPPRAEPLVERLCQLGAAALVPLLLERTPPRSRNDRPERLGRIADEALKQSGRLWPLELGAPSSLAAAIEAREPGALIVLDPRAEEALWSVLETLPLNGPDHTFKRNRPLALVAGPEGGFTENELEQLTSHNSHRARLAPHILRIETAAEAAAAIVAQFATRA